MTEEVLSSHKLILERDFERERVRVTSHRTAPFGKRTVLRLDDDDDDVEKKRPDEGALPADDTLRDDRADCVLFRGRRPSVGTFSVRR